MTTRECVAYLTEYNFIAQPLVEQLESKVQTLFAQQAARCRTCFHQLGARAKAKAKAKPKRAAK